MWSGEEAGGVGPRRRRWWKVAGEAVKDVRRERRVERESISFGGVARSALMGMDGSECGTSRLLRELSLLQVGAGDALKVELSRHHHHHHHHLQSSRTKPHHRASSPLSVASHRVSPPSPPHHPRYSTMAHPFDPATTTTHHEFSLYAYIPSAVYPQLLRVLSSLTLTKPAEYTSHHLVWRPAYRSVAPPNPQSAISRAPELYYIQLVAGYEEGKSPREQRWTIRLEDTPEVTRKPVVSRQVLEAGTGEGDVVTFMGALGYT